MSPTKTPAKFVYEHLLNDESYLRAVAGMSQRIDRILSGSDTVVVSAEPGKPAPVANVPAYQMGENIVLVPDEIVNMVQDPNDEREVLPLLLSLNLHEYGHYDFTPNPKNSVWENLKAGYVVAKKPWSSIFQWLNVLEDQRQELLVSTRYPRARNYFRLANLRSMLMVKRKVGHIPPENFMLYYGRRHILPRPLLNRLEAALIQNYSGVKVGQAKDLIDEFLTLPSTTEAALKRQWQIAEEMDKMFPKPPDSGRAPCLTTGSIGARVQKSTQEQTSKDAGDLLARIDAHGDPGDTGGTIEDYIDKAEELSASDMRGRMDQVATEIFGGAARKLANIFRLVATDLGMVDFNRLRSGKLDIRRVPAAVASREDRIFRYRRQDLRREAAMLVHILLDSSGSMNDKQKVAVDACSTIGRAAELASHVSKISTFSSSYDHATIKEWKEAMDPSKFKWFGGGTNPVPVLKGSWKDFQRASIQYKANNSVLIVVTDGGFDDPMSAAAEFRTLKARGVHIFLIGIGASPSEYGGTHYDVDGVMTVNSVNELEPVMRGMLKRLSVQITHDVMRKYAP